jgi:hypothetical protein
VRRGHGAAGACHGGLQRGRALVQVHRVHLGQQLAGLDRVADVDQHLADAAGHGRPDQVGAARLDRADAEQRWRQAADGWPAVPTVTRVGASGPERMTTKASAAISSTPSSPGRAGACQ